jgi:hypothetical protein
MAATSSAGVSKLARAGNPAVHAWIAWRAAGVVAWLAHSAVRAAKGSIQSIIGMGIAGVLA